MSVTSIELLVISRLLTTEKDEEIDALCEFDESFYVIYTQQIKFILEHKTKYGVIPDVFTFQAEFPKITIVKVTEPLNYLIEGLKNHKKRIILIETFNKLKDLGSGDVQAAWEYFEMQYERASQLDSMKPLDIVKDAKFRAQQIVDFNSQARIPTGFPAIDKLMYGGLSTVEELVVLVARTNTGKSWICTKMMESAQRNGFPVLYYSPEMQASFLGTRFDTWRTHTPNSQLHRGDYTESYKDYLEKLSDEETSALVLEDKDVPDNNVNITALTRLVKRYGIKLLIIDGLSYMEDIHRSDSDHIKYKNLCNDLFRLSKQAGCAVVVAMQANRETKECRDDKGEPFPNIYNIEGSDHPARIATQVFAVRQIFDKHVLDIRLEKSRNANNQKPVISYAWDINTGNMQELPSGDATAGVMTPISPSVVTNVSADDDIGGLDDDVEF